MAENESVTPQDGDADATDDSTPAGQNLSRERLEQELGRAKRDIAKLHERSRTLDDDARAEKLRESLRSEYEAKLAEAQKDAAKAKFAFDDEESYTRAQQALAELQKVEDAKRSEVEKLTERSEQLLYRATESDKALMRLRAALGAGIPPARVDEFASRLRGDTLEELTADAAELAVLFAPTKPERRSDPSQGAGSDVRPVGNPLQAALESKLGIPRP